MGNGTAVPSGSPVPTSAVGSHTLTVRSTNTVNGRSRSASKSVTYTVTSVKYALTVAKAGTGTGTVTSSPSGIDCGATCSASYSSGTIVKLTAAAASGSTFVGWTGGCSGTSTCSVTMSATKNVTATFSLPAPPVQYSLTVLESGAGTGTVTSSPTGINCGLTCSANYNSGTVVNLTATPASGSLFAGWSGACSGTAGCSVTMSAAKSVSAEFGVAPPPPPACTNGYVGITFDDGPSSLSQQYVDALNAGGAHATFFNIGDNMTLPGGFPDVNAMEVANGEVIGNHTMTHPDITGQSLGTQPLTDAQITSQLQNQAAIVNSQVPGGYTENLMRPPYGDESTHSFGLIASLGYTSVMWTGKPNGQFTGDTQDWDQPASTTPLIVSRFLATAQDQAVILQHDGYPTTLAAIPQELAGLKAKGLCPGMIVPDPTNGDNQFDYNGLPMNLKVIAWPNS